MMKSRTVICLANGCEEIEALTVADILRRAGEEVALVSVNETTDVVSSHNVHIVADAVFADIDFSGTEMLILPGGMPGSNNLQAYKPLEEQILKFYEEGKYIAAICAAPKVFGALGLLEGKNACCHPGFEGELKGANVIMNKPAVKDGNVITGRSMGCAIPFGLTILGALNGADAANAMAQKLVYMPVETITE